MTQTTEANLAYPMARAGQCPFDPPRELAQIQNGERITRVRLWDGSQPWLITGYEQSRTVLADPRLSVDTDLQGYPHHSAGSLARRQVTKSFINMDDPQHDKIRRLLTQDFMVRRVQAMRPRIQELVDGLIDDMLAGPKPADLVETLALPLPSLIICDLLGVPYADRDLFHQRSRTMISRSSTPEQAVAALEELLEFMGALIDSKNREPADDIVSRLVVEQLRTGQMSRDELVSLCQLLLVAGHETTGNMIALGTLALLQHPDVLAEVRATDDPKVIANTVEELLRWLTVLHIGRRRVALEDFEIEGHQIRAGEGVIIAHDIANRDPEAFPDPDKLDIHRRSRHHIAFGYGVHQCLGQPLARVELQVVYGTLYRRIPTLRLAVDFEQLNFKDHNIVYGVHELPVTW
jgi:cytochrome P450